MKGQVSVTIGTEAASSDVAQLLQALSPDEIAPYAWLVKLPPTLAAHRGDELAGIAVSSTYELHPERAWSTVLVAPAFRRQKIGTRLHRALVEANPTPLKAKVASTASGARAFAESLGLRPLVKSHLLDMPLSTSLADRLPAPDSFDLRRVQLPPDVEFRSAVAQLYRRIHAWDLPGPEADARIAELLCADIAFAFEAHHHGKVIGVALAHPSARAGFVEAAMIGTVTPDDRGAPTTAALLAAVLREGHRVELEVDEGPGAHDDLLQVARRLVPSPWPAPTLIVSTA